MAGMDALFGSTNRTDILVAVARLGETYVAELGRLLALRPTEVGRALSSLERAGVARADSCDNPSHLAGLDARALRFRGSALARDVPLLLSTLAEELLEPAFRAPELDVVQKSLSGSLTVAHTDTMRRAIQRFCELNYDQGDPNFQPSIEELLTQAQSLTTDAVREYHDRFVNGGRLILSIAGDIDPDMVLRHVRETFGQFHVKRNEGWLTAAASVPSRRREFVEIAHKASRDIVLGRPTDLVRSSPDYYAAMLANGILGDSAISSVLGERLRIREGLTYSVVSRFGGVNVAAAPWHVVVSTNPENVERTIASTTDVLARYAETGPTERQVESQKNAFCGRTMVSLGTNAGIAGVLEDIANFGLGDDYVDTLRERISGIPHESISAAARKYMHSEDLTIVSAGSPNED